MAADTIPAAACPNCHRPLALPRPRFCPDCGQETTVRPPTLLEFAQQFGGAYLSTEGALWRTLKLLLTKPGELTRQYLAGRRKHYVLPLRLYLTISVTALLLLRWFGAVELDTGPGRASSSHGSLVTIKVDASEPKAVRNFLLRVPGGGSAGLRQGVFFCERLPATMCARLQQRIDLDPKAMAGAIAQLEDRFLGNLGGAMFLLLPSLALWLSLVYRSRGWRYTEHLVMALHLHAFWFIALGLSALHQTWLTVIAFSAVPWYSFLAMRRVYGGRVGWRLVRGVLVIVLYVMTLLFALAAVGLWTLLS